MTYLILVAPQDITEVPTVAVSNLQTNDAAGGEWGARCPVYSYWSHALEFKMKLFTFLNISPSSHWFKGLATEGRRGETFSILQSVYFSFTLSCFFLEKPGFFFGLKSLNQPHRCALQICEAQFDIRIMPNSLFSNLLYDGLQEYVILLTHSTNILQRTCIDFTPIQMLVLKNCS